jgi:hypothetical protein
METITHNNIHDLFAFFQVYAWGSSQYGQLGVGKTGQCPYPQLVEHLSREHIIAVSAGQYHSIALADDGRSGKFSSVAIRLIQAYDIGGEHYCSLAHTYNLVN